MHTLTPWAFAPALGPELSGLVDDGVLERAAARDLGARERPELVATATRRGLVTAAQARALAGLLGLGAGPANDP